MSRIAPSDFMQLWSIFSEERLSNNISGFGGEVMGSVGSGSAGNYSNTKYYFHISHKYFKSLQNVLYMSIFFPCFQKCANPLIFFHKQHFEEWRLKKKEVKCVSGIRRN